MKHDIESFLQTLAKQWGAIGTLKITQTILDKGNPDANKSIQSFALAMGIDFASLPKGGRNGVKIEGRYSCSGKPCKINFYRANGRGDCRLSITGLKHHAKAGDTIAIHKDIITGAIVVNATKETQ